MDLVVWKEKGLSTAEEAEERYQKILAGEDSVPFSSLAEQLQEFVRQASTKFPEAILTVSEGDKPEDATFSSCGLVLRFNEDMDMTAYPTTADIATPLDLTIYDPEMGLVEGYDDSMDIEILDNE